jgi:hypothetical protein
MAELENIKQKINLYKNIGYSDNDIFHELTIHEKEFLIKSFSSELQDKFPEAEWKTINGAKVLVNDGKVIAGLEGFNGTIDEFVKQEEPKNKSKRVKHSKFGEGTILKEDEDRISIDFDSVGLKFLLKKFANLEYLDGSKLEVNNNNDDIKDVVLIPKTDKKEDEKPIKPKKEIVKDESIKIKKETQKAKLLTKDGIDFWVQNKWYNEDTGKLTPAGERSFNESKETNIQNKEVETSDKFKINGESESGKAYKIGITINNGFEEQNIEVYMPKSKVERNGDKISINKEFLKEKTNELRQKHGLTKVTTRGVKVTDKAIGVTYNVDYIDVERDITKIMWFPKTQIKEKDGEYYIPNWLYDKKKEEAYDNLEGRGGSKNIELENSFDYAKLEIKKAILLDVL